MADSSNKPGSGVLRPEVNPAGSSFASSSIQLNINAVVAATKSSKFVFPASLHICATQVRKCLEAGGMSTVGRPNYAKAYVSYLPKKGYTYLKTLSTLEEQRAFTKNEARLCDIAVYKHYADSTGWEDNTGKPGHICIWNGTNWTSDFTQQDMNVYSGRPSVYARIYRFTGVVDNSPVDLSKLEAGASGGGFSGFGGGGGGTRGSNFLGQKHMTNEELNKDIGNREELISFLRTTTSEIPDTPPPMVLTKNKSTLEHDSITIERMD